MGKRSDFPRVARDFYPTPEAAVRPLLLHLPEQTIFVEPCAGDGTLVRHLQRAGHISGVMIDIEPRASWIVEADALTIIDDEIHGCDYIITNPPWPARHGRGEPTLSMIKHFASLRPTWLLLSADFAHNAYFGQVSASCVKIVAVGRVEWIEGSEHTGKDNAAWYLFDARHEGQTAFYGRAA